MRAKRRNHDPNLKARVALEALREEKSIQQISVEYDIHPTQVKEWKEELLQGAGSLFERGEK